MTNKSTNKLHVYVLLDKSSAGDRSEDNFVYTHE